MSHFASPTPHSFKSMTVEMIIPGDEQADTVAGASQDSPDDATEDRYYSDIAKYIDDLEAQMKANTAAGASQDNLEVVKEATFIKAVAKYINDLEAQWKPSIAAAGAVHNHPGPSHPKACQHDRPRSYESLKPSMCNALGIPMEDLIAAKASADMGPDATEERKANKKPLFTDPLKNLTQGYPKLAGRMVLMPETAIFRRFTALNCRNLLYLQSELYSLEMELGSWEVHDSWVEKGLKPLYALDHLHLRSATAQRDGDTNQRDLVKKMRDTLKEYNQALIQQAMIMEMKKPDPYDLNDLQHFLSHEVMGPFCLRGADKDTWGSYLDPKGHSNDLVCLKPRLDADSFSRWFSSHAVSIVTKLCPGPLARKPSAKYGTMTFQQTMLFKLTFWFTSIIASVIPIASIAVLNVLDSTTKRIATIAAFNVLIAASLCIFTEAKRYELFAITASFAAVQVVFVGTADIGSSRRPECKC